MKNWYTKTVEESLHAQGVDLEKGLAVREAHKRLLGHGPNALAEKEGKSPWAILAEQFKSLLVVLLIAAAGVSGAVLGEWVDAGVIGVIVILNALLGFRQEFKAEKAMEALKKFSVPLVRVLRGGQERQVKSNELVPGDVVFLEAGDLVPADCRLVEAADLKAEEASLTGESLPVEKGCGVLEDPETPLGDRRNMVYMGTVLTYGRGKGVVVATGMRTQLGRIADKLQTVVKEDTPLQVRLARLGRFLVLGSLALIAVVSGVGLLQGQSVRAVFLTAVSMAVAAVPEGLPAAVTIALALGAQRMLRRNALIRKLPAVETLGSVTTICSDKTGTLTQNRMTVNLLSLPTPGERQGKDGDQSGANDGALSCVDRSISTDPPIDVATETPGFFKDSPSSELALVGVSLCCDATVTTEDTLDLTEAQCLGDPTEGALVVAGLRFGLNKKALESVLPRVEEAPFDSDRKRMTTVHSLSDVATRLEGLPEGLVSTLKNLGGGAAPQYVSFCKGACDPVLEKCSHVWLDGRAVALTTEAKELLSEKNAHLAADGVRVLGVAVRAMDELPASPSAETMEEDLTFVGLVGMVDPVRPEAREAVNNCVTAGIRPVMITGDHPLMAKYIARELGMIQEDKDPSDEPVVTGRDLVNMKEEGLRQVVRESSVFARVAPEHKLRIVDALQENGELCAMTGDGVNDAPALKSADIGVAMGITGTDVSKEASDMVLQDDNFATIVAAVEEGRTIFGNIRRFVRYLLACNTGELWLFFIAPLLGMPLPLLPVQILWMNLVTDGFPALGLGIEPPERDIMQRPPRDPKSPILGLGQALHVVWVGLFIATTAMAVAHYVWVQAGSPGAGGHGASVNSATWQTMLFSTMVFSQLFLSFAERADRNSLFTIGLTTNPHMLWAVFGTFLLQLGVIYLPPAQKMFNTVALNPAQLGIAIAVGLLAFLAVEIEKAIKRTRPIKEA